MGEPGTKIILTILTRMVEHTARHMTDPHYEGIKRLSDGKPNPDVFRNVF